MSNDTEHIAMQGSTIDYCDRWPEEGHNWSTTVHAAQHGQRIETRQCGSCGYLDVSEAAKALASSHAEGVRDGLRIAVDAFREAARETRAKAAEHVVGPYRWTDADVFEAQAMAIENVADALASLTPTTEEST